MCYNQNWSFKKHQWKINRGQGCHVSVRLWGQKRSLGSLNLRFFMGAVKDGISWLSGMLYGAIWKWQKKTCRWKPQSWVYWHNNITHRETTVISADSSAEQTQFLRIFLFNNHPKPSVERFLMWMYSCFITVNTNDDVFSFFFTYKLCVERTSETKDKHRVRTTLSHSCCIYRFRFIGISLKMLFTILAFVAVGLLFTFRSFSFTYTHIQRLKLMISCHSQSIFIGFHWHFP